MKYLIAAVVLFSSAWVSAQAEPDPLPDPVFEELDASAGFRFTHFNGMTGEYLLPEIMGAGAALFDYDGDGDLDLYLVQGATYPSDKAKPPLHPFKDGPPSDRLFRNDLSTDPKGHKRLRFTDVTAAAGILPGGFGMGVASGDIDNDGDVDLYVTNLGANRLYVNDGKGGFSERAKQAGVEDDSLSTSAVFLDYDGDGFLDLFVVNYIRFSAERSPKCYASNSALDYCGPDAYSAHGDRMFRNRGDGSFEDRTNLLRDVTAGAGLGVEILDADGDGLLDLYVANDGDPNHLWRNKGGGQLEEIALFSGVALNGQGVPEAGMGVTAADFDGDGDEDLFLTHLERETNTLYVNQKGAYFDDGSKGSGLDLPSIPFTGFGTRFFDLQNDGLLDLLVVNGAVRDQLEQGGQYPLRQTNQLFINRDGKRFVDVSATGGKAFKGSEVSRGAAFGDLDNDGDCDLLITNSNGPARLLLNRAGGANHWLGFRVLAAGDKRDAIGALVELTIVAGGPTLTRRVNAGGSYLCAHDPRVLFGLAGSKTYHHLQVTWPDGFRREFKGGASDRYLVVKREQ